MFDISSLLNAAKTFGSKALAFGNKNAPILMTGSSIAIGWYAVYLFWKQSRNADKRIAYEEQRAKEEAQEKDKDADVSDVKLETKRKVEIYFEYCWLSLLLGATSTGLAIAAQKLSIDRLTQMYVMTQFLADKNDKKQQVIDEFEKTVGDKKANEVKDRVRSGRFSDEELIRLFAETPGEGTLIVDDTMHSSRKRDLMQFDKDLCNLNDILMQRFKRVRDRYIDKKVNGPFYVNSDSPYPTDPVEIDRIMEEASSDVFASLSLEEFLRGIGMVPKDDFGLRIGELQEFRYYGGKSPIAKNQILEFKNFFMPDGTKMTYGVLDYTDLLCPTYESLERNPL